MDSKDYIAYYLPAVEAVRLVLKRDLLTNADFEEFLGLNILQPYQDTTWWFDCTLEDNVRNLFQALNSPHCLAVLKIWRIKKGLEK